MNIPLYSGVLVLSQIQTNLIESVDLPDPHDYGIVYSPEQYDRACIKRIHSFEHADSVEANFGEMLYSTQ